jgi:hypothetical protein
MTPANPDTTSPSTSTVKRRAPPSAPPFVLTQKHLRIRLVSERIRLLAADGLGLGRRARVVLGHAPAALAGQAERRVRVPRRVFRRMVPDPHNDRESCPVDRVVLRRGGSGYDNCAVLTGPEFERGKCALLCLEVG